MAVVNTAFTLTGVTVETFDSASFLVKAKDLFPDAKDISVTVAASRRRLQSGGVVVTTKIMFENSVGGEAHVKADAAGPLSPDR